MILLAALACLAIIGLSASVAVAAPVAPVISGPTSVQFSYHPSGFRSAVVWDPVPTAVEYRIYNADTLVLIGTNYEPSAMIYGMQGFLYHHYVVAVDAAGNTSPPSNVVDIQTSAPLPPAAPAGFAVLPTTVFDLRTSTAPAVEIPIKIPYTAAEVTGDPGDLRLMHYTGSAWEDVTTSVDTTSSFVNGVASPSSVFAVMESDGTEPPAAVATTTPSTDQVSLATTTFIYGPSSVRARRVLELTGLVSRYVATYSGSVVGSTLYLPSTSGTKTVTVR